MFLAVVAIKKRNVVDYLETDTLLFPTCSWHVDLSRRADRKINTGGSLLGQPASRIHHDPRQQPEVVSAMPDLVHLPRRDGSPLLVLPESVQLCRAEATHSRRQRLGGSNVAEGGSARPRGEHSGLTGEAAVCDVEHEARPLCWGPPVALSRLLLCRLGFLPSILFSLQVLCGESSGVVYLSCLECKCCFECA